MNWDWLHTLWFGYFYPSLKGNGPEDFLFWLAFGVIGAFAVRWALKEWQEHKANVEAAHVKLNHIIRSSPHIDNTVPGLADKHQP